MGTQLKGNSLTGERITLLVCVISVTLYLFNIILGKAAIHWGWDVFYLGNISEFLLVLTASISFVIAALHCEVRENDQNNQ